MNPLEEYISIIHQRQQNPLPKEEYGEIHHIIPRSLGGCNKAWNKVRLTPEEHYRAHCLLPFIYTTGEGHMKMTYAWHRMRCVQGKDAEISEEEYGRLQREYSEAKANERRGKPSGMKGKHHTEEARRKMSESGKGHKAWNKGIPFDEDYKRRMSERCKGIPKSEETKRRISETRRSHHHHLTEEQKRHLSEINRGKPGHNKGKKFGPMSEETKRKMLESRKAFWQSPLGEEARRRKSEKSKEVWARRKAAIG